jgi:hypothetical protein
MKDSDIKILENNGWIVECESPFEISQENGSFASNNAAKLILETLRRENPNPLKILCNDLTNILEEYQANYYKKIECVIKIKDETLETETNFSFNGEKFIPVSDIKKARKTLP